MSLIKYNPFLSKQDPFNSLFDQFFNGSLTNFVGSDFVKSEPSINVVESEKDFRIELAAPGLVKEDFNIKVEKDNLIISVEKKNEEVTEDEKFTRREFAFTSFTRSFNLGEQVNPEAISAAYENGVLNITLPKKEEAVEVKRTIEIA